MPTLKALSPNPSPNPTPNPSPTPDPADVAATLVLSDGSIAYTAEHYGLTQEQVLNLVASDPSAHEMMARQFRTKALIAQFEVMGTITGMLASRLPDMRGDHLISAFKAISGSFATLSAGGQIGAAPSVNNTTIFERAIPANVRAALAVVRDISPDDPDLLAITERIAHIEASSAQNEQVEPDTQHGIQQVSAAHAEALPVQRDLRARALSLLNE